ncbi:MAG: phosphate ABC transporter ATP-binding protein PstB, partial [Candidatus Sumerlaeaceae bacterium]
MNTMLLAPQEILGRAKCKNNESGPTVVDPSLTNPLACPSKAEVRHLNFWYGANQILHDVSIEIKEHCVTALIGPSGCGKTTLLRCFNRMHDLYPGNRYAGEITLYPDGVNIVGPSTDPIEMRMRIGMVFQKPNPYPKSIFENVAFGLRLRGIRGSELRDRVEWALKSAALWEETRNRLNENALSLSGGQQQRLCLARALATMPEILLLDEPTSALDPIATARIEELIDELRGRLTIIIVTHNMAQAQRVADVTAFMYLGRLVEVALTKKLFEHAEHELTREYVLGR